MSVVPVYFAYRRAHRTSNRLCSGASSSYLVSAGPTSNDYEPPMPLSSTIHLPRIKDEQVSFPRW